MLKKHSTIMLWVIPLLFFIHNLEESFQMPQYLANQFSIHFITSQQFFIAISALTIFVLLITFLYQLNFLSSIYWIIFIQGAIFFNSVQHIILFSIYRSYNPGVISAVFIVIFSIFFFSFEKHLILKKQFILTLIFSLFSYPVIIWITLLFASYFHS
ncbi:MULTISPECIES: HXXEE domain-containing protein [Bacillus]|uniref:HXXEE domain-containing protein n=1 Tax=Bacillus wiedmannii TaxID=1890302 RepID=A0A2B5XPT7_9BACI|nr:MULTISPECIES: HXXEE domain-containing protein [Bacillus]KAA0783129.1 HXXEE domain-containing protein [Bacillus sp. BPN334]MBY7114646.1 HXXEE domain-containing protein [Bacillus sp. 17RED48]MBY7125539.1 HXXEE domain-containing protein [Bacillus sp. 16GRE42]MCR6845036.1 HXXEE domain-containing protein [Bacillus sp. IBL03825]MCU5112766.1 HXXEE domain-containing protein [Bacillus wiedmannii]